MGRSRFYASLATKPKLTKRTPNGKTKKYNVLVVKTEPPHIRDMKDGPSYKNNKTHKGKIK